MKKPAKAKKQAKKPARTPSRRTVPTKQILPHLEALASQKELDDCQIEAILIAARKGAHPEIAAGTIGLLPSHYRKLEHQGAMDLAAGNPTTQNAKLVAALLMTMSNFEVRQLERVVGTKEERHSASWLLERRFPGRWANKAPAVSIDLTQAEARATTTELETPKPDVILHEPTLEEAANMMLMYESYVAEAEGTSDDEDQEDQVSDHSVKVIPLRSAS